LSIYVVVPKVHRLILKSYWSKTIIHETICQPNGNI